MGLTRAERFKKIATNRTNRILDDLRLLGNCSNKANYDYSEEEIKKIFNAIETELKHCKFRFNSNNKERFEL